MGKATRAKKKALREGFGSLGKNPFRKEGITDNEFFSELLEDNRASVRKKRGFR